MEVGASGGTDGTTRGSLMPTRSQGHDSAKGRIRDVIVFRATAGGGTRDDSGAKEDIKSPSAIKVGVLKIAGSDKAIIIDGGGDNGLTVLTPAVDGVNVAVVVETTDGRLRITISQSTSTSDGALSVGGDQSIREVDRKGVSITSNVVSTVGQGEGKREIAVNAVLAVRGLLNGERSVETSHDQLGLAVSTPTISLTTDGERILEGVGRLGLQTETVGGSVCAQTIKVVAVLEEGHADGTSQ